MKISALRIYPSDEDGERQTTACDVAPGETVEHLMQRLLFYGRSQPVPILTAWIELRVIKEQK